MNMVYLEKSTAIESGANNNFQSQKIYKMKSYIITDRSTESTKYYAGLNGWVNLPENSIWYETEKEATEQKEALKDDNLKIEVI